MIVIDGVPHYTPPLSQDILATIHTIATLHSDRVVSSVPHEVTWRRLHGLPSSDRPQAANVLLATPKNEVVAIGTWIFGGPVILARGRLICAPPTEPSYDPPPLKVPRTMGTSSGEITPVHITHSIKEILDSVDRLSLYTRLDRAAATCQNKPQLLTVDQLMTLVLPAGEVQDYFAFFWANTVSKLTQAEHVEAALYHLAKVDMLSNEMVQKIGAHLVKRC
jgi:hypothetical protein